MSSFVVLNSCSLADRWCGDRNVRDLSQSYENGFEELVCVTFNARSVVNKLDYLFSFLENFKPDVVGVTESWCRIHLPDSLFEHHDYVLFRQDRVDSTGGGVLLFVRTYLKPVPIIPVESSFPSCSVNCAWCFIEFRGKLASVGCVYRAPSSSAYFDMCLMKEISHVCSLEHEYKILLGDFNLPSIHWDTGSCTTVDNSFFNCFADNFLTQVIMNATRGKNILDLFFVNDPSLVNNVEISSPFPGSDHQTVWVRLSMTNSDVNSRRTRSMDASFDFKKANWECYEDHIASCDWDTIFCSSDIEEVWSSFKTVIYNAAKASIPLKRKRRFIRGVPCDGEVKRAWRARKRLHKLCRDCDSSFANRVRKSADDRLSWAIASARKRHEARIGVYAKTNPKLFWSMIRSHVAVRASIPSIMKPDGSSTKDDMEAADTFNAYYSSVFIKEDLTSLPKVKNKSACSLSSVAFSEEDVRKALKSLPENSSPGPDNISYPLLKNGGENMIYACARLFELLFTSHAIPREWKMSVVIPVYKGKGSKNNPQNYRPISLTSVFCKVMERIIKKTLVNYIRSNGLLRSSQHGFVEKRSCLTNLLSFLEHITSAIDSKLCVDVAYLDFSRAFDSVPHERLLIKLESYGIVGNLAAWISAFLKQRVQCVSVRGSISSLMPVLSGVPQGSVIGPLLFLLYVDDLDSVLSYSFILKFADDAKIYNIFNPRSISYVSSPLNDDLSKVFSWCETWCMRLNTTKCSCVHFGYNNPCLPVLVEDQCIESVQSVKDLGVWVSSDLKPSLQCSMAALRGQRMLNLIKLCFKHLDVFTLARLFKVFVRPLLEYCSTAWCPYFTKDIVTIERVQRRMTRMIPHLRRIEYKDRLTCMNLQSLSLRRLRFDLICVFRILHNLIDIDPSFFFRNAPSSVTRNRFHKLFINFNRLDVRCNFFSQCVISPWNNLPDVCVNAPSFTVFKSELDCYLSRAYPADL